MISINVYLSARPQVLKGTKTVLPFTHWQNVAQSLEHSKHSKSIYSIVHKEVKWKEKVLSLDKTDYLICKLAEHIKAWGEIPEM